MSFWDNLPKPFFVLAPMEDVTDTVFRQIICKVGKPSVMFTEFANVDAIVHGETSRLKHTDIERPLVAQIWGKDPEKFAQAAKIIVSMGFDGIDLNFGCPVRDVFKQGVCSAMIGDKIHVAEIIEAVNTAGLPVSVKTRLGIKKIITEEWIGWLLEQNLAAITIHGRTVAEQSKVQAHWDQIGKAVKMKQMVHSSSLIVGNGDIENLVEAREMVERYGVDGVMIARGIFKNPWIFDNDQATIHKPQERIDLLLFHLKLWGETYGTKNFQVMKKFVKMYISGWEGAAELRAKLMETKSAEEMVEKLK